MSNVGYLTEKREETIAKFLDASIDFGSLLKGQKKILGIFSLGNFLERNDRRIFKMMLGILDDKVIGANPNQDVKDTIDKALAFLENGDVVGFDNYIAGVLADVIETPFGVIEKQIFLSVLMMFNGLIAKALVKIESKINEADSEV